MANNNTQVLWGKTKIMVIEHTPQYKIYKALHLVYEALRGNFPFAYALIKSDGFGFDEVTYKQHKSNYKKLYNALTLLYSNGYVVFYTLRCGGRLVVFWWTGDLKLTKAAIAEKLNDTYDLSVFKEPCPRTMKQVALQDRSDHTAVKQPWCDGQPLHSKHEHGISGEDYEYARKHNVKISRLPKNYIE